MAIKKKTLNISRVAAEATMNYVAPKPLATNDAVRNKIVQETPAPKPLRRVCTIQKVGVISTGANWDWVSRTQSCSATSAVSMWNSKQKAQLPPKTSPQTTSRK